MHHAMELPDILQAKSRCHAAAVVQSWNRPNCLSRSLRYKEAIPKRAAGKAVRTSTTPCGGVHISVSLEAHQAANVIPNVSMRARAHKQVPSFAHEDRVG